ncbi:phage scaffolding protein, partial [Peptostreptococcus anaerobius]|uniref:phage scaffolding protein n=1 Tax=Peptostreptococcus anaerobius TaxID=1261 RepID=UPI002586836A
MEWLNEILKDVEGKEEIIKSIKKGIGENFVSKADFNTKNETVKTLEKTIKDRDEQLETLKNSKEDTQTLKATIETLQKENKANEDKYQADIKAMKLDSAIKLSIAGKVHDEELVTGLFNKDTLIV